MDLGLEGKVAVVVAASRGLGFASAQALAAEGCRLAICSRSQDAITAAAERLRAEQGAEVVARPVDLTDASAVHDFIAAVEAAYGRIDVLVTNSGGPPPGTFDELDEAAFAAANELLLLNPVRLVKAALPALRRHGDGGRIIAVTSCSTREVLPNLMLSNAVRAAVVGWAKTLARELAAEGITVNCLAPGMVDTERIAELGAAVAKRQGISVEQVRRNMLAAQPSGRLGEPAEFGAACAFLASRQAAYISGTTVYVDGANMRTVV
ncbi:MAG: SDR family oxidoreductase [Planctomycetota bacterium]|jgi:3-oxoacyl-[acyl-carrier protein] reductase|nr:SDR family oxidoreductase [Planctomycetota bacterium]